MIQFELRIIFNSVVENQPTIVTRALVLYASKKIRVPNRPNPVTSKDTTQQVKQKLVAWVMVGSTT